MRYRAQAPPPARRASWLPTTKHLIWWCSALLPRLSVTAASDCRREDPGDLDQDLGDKQDYLHGEVIHAEDLPESQAEESGEEGTTN